VAVWGDHYDLSRNATGWGGFAGLKALFDQQEPGTIRLCTGDILYPNDLSSRDGGRHRIDILNDFNLTATILGNHDLDGGEENAKNRIVESHFSWLAANAVDRQGNYFTGDHQTILIDRDGIKVGIFGLISETTPTIVVRKNNITFTSMISTARKMVEELKGKGAQLILAGTHMDPGEDERLALEVPGIHAIFGGHDHSKMARLIGNTLLIKPGQEAECLAKVKFLVETQASSAQVQVTPSWEFIANQKVEEDFQMLTKTRQYQQALDQLKEENDEEWKKEPIARLDQDYDTLENNLRAGNSAFATLIAASLQEYGQADLGFLFGGCIRNKRIYQKGDLFTYNDAKAELKFPDKFAVIEASGRMLLEALENGVSKMPEKDGRFPQLSDMVYSFDVSRPVGSRILAGSVYIQGKLLDSDRMYKVATSNVIVDGKIGYEMFNKAKVLFPYSDNLLIVDIFANYVKNIPSMTLATDADQVCDIAMSCDPVSQQQRLRLPFFAESGNDGRESAETQKDFTP
jgi:2',3'-cyclic-nucleotide 2'-phosphodiesterase (5'-nucleotidase family)